MNKRKFIKSFGALAVGCMMAGGLSWRSLKTESVKTGKWIENPEWVNAEYDIHFVALTSEAQKAILRDFTLAITDDSHLSGRFVPMI